MTSANHTKIPLHSLLALLRKEGFEIGTSTLLDLQRVVANINEEQVDNTDELQYLLAPIICRNKEEQQKFYRLFRDYQETIRKQPVSLEQTEKGKRKKWNRWFWWAGFVLLLALGGYLLYLIIPPDEEVVTLGIKPISDNKTTLPGDTVTLSVVYADSSKAENYSTDWQMTGPGNFKKDFQHTQKITTVVDSAGSYQAIASTFDADKTLLKKDTILVDVLCEMPPSVTISKNEGANGDVYFSALIEGGSPDTGYHFHWFVNDRSVPGDSIMRTGLLKPNSQNIVSVKVDWPFKKLHCSVDSLYNQFEVQPPFQLTISGDDGAPLNFGSRYNWPNILLGLSALLLLPSLVAGAVRMRLRSLKKKKQKELEEAEQQGDEELVGPHTIEFKNQQDKIMPETGISQLAETLRKRHTSDVFQLSIQKTIKSTIRRGGFPVLEYLPRTQPTDFLILLDKEYPQGHLVNLFNYVIERLKKEQVHLTVYTFSKEPLLLSNESLKQVLLPIDKVARLYPETMLIIFSQADAFFKSYNVGLKNWVEEKFKSWKTKLIITPLPKKDWGAKELALYDAGFTVVPADTNAHAIIGDEINQMIDRQILKKEIVPETYSANKYNFNRWRQVHAYLQKALSDNNYRMEHAADINLVEQWLCALAVYPHVNWQVTIAIGKAFEDKYARPGELVNYNNLLVLSRIQWMNDHQLMDSLRVEMLNLLEKDKEALARTVIMQLMEEIAPTIQSNSMVKNEWDLLEASNTFLLKANEEGGQALTSEELNRFKQYLDKDQLDWTLQTYLDKGQNTLLNDPSNADKSMPLQEYLQVQQKKLATPDSKAAGKPGSFKELARKWLPAASFVIIALIGLLVLRTKERLQFTSLQQIANLTFAAHDSIAAEALPVTSLSLLLGGQQYEGTLSTDNTYTIDNVPLADSINQGILQIDLREGSVNASIDISNARYVYNIKTIVQPENEMPVVPGTAKLPDALNEIWKSGDLIVAFYLKSNLSFYRDIRGKASGQTQIIEASRPDSSTYKIITKNAKDGDFGVLFARDITSNSVQWGRCQNTDFPTIEEARRYSLANCGDFLESKVFYENTTVNSNRFKIELPVNSTDLVATELRKLNLAVEKFSKLPRDRRAYVAVSVNVNSFLHSTREVLTRQAEITASNLLSKIATPNPGTRAFAGSAFQRDYIQIDFEVLPEPNVRADCGRVFKSIREASTVDPRVICKIDLSNQKLTSMPKEVSMFPNLQELNISGNEISEREIKVYSSAHPGVKIINIDYSNNPDIQQQGPEKYPPHPALNTVVKVALGEVNSNKGGGASAKYLKTAGLSSEEMWNAAFVYWCYSYAGYTPFRRTGSGFEIWNSLPTENKVSAAAALKDPSLIVPGNIYFIREAQDNSNAGKGGDYFFEDAKENYRVGIVVSVGKGVLECVEANTAIAPTRRNYPNEVMKIQHRISEINVGYSNFVETPKAGY